MVLSIRNKSTNKAQIYTVNMKINHLSIVSFINLNKITNLISKINSLINKIINLTNKITNLSNKIVN